MAGLEELGLLGLFIGTFLAATIVPFSSDAVYLAILAATGNPVGCLAVGTLGNWLGRCWCRLLILYGLNNPRDVLPLWHHCQFLFHHRVVQYCKDLRISQPLR